MTLAELKLAAQKLDSAAMIIPPGGRTALYLHSCSPAELDQVVSLLLDRGDKFERRVDDNGASEWDVVCADHDCRVRIIAFGERRPIADVDPWWWTVVQMARLELWHRADECEHGRLPIELCAPCEGGL